MGIGFESMQKLGVEHMKVEEFVRLVRAALTAESGLTPDLAEKFPFPDGIKRVKIDVGMSLDAGHARRWLLSDSELLVIGFEPLERCRRSIEKVFIEPPIESEHRKRLWLLPFALGSTSAITDFYHCEDPGQSSLYLPTRFQVLERIKVVQVTLALVLDQMSFAGNVRRVDHVKTDCQGADFQVAKGASEYLNLIAVWTSETDSFGYSDSRNKSLDFLRLFRDAGFKWFNRRSQLRVFVGRRILSSKYHSVYLSGISALKKIGLAGGEQPEGSGSIHVEDPTFVNERFLDEIARGEITAFQSG
jgi:FkbM family methyltransferase